MGMGRVPSSGATAACTSIFSSPRFILSQKSVRSDKLFLQLGFIVLVDRRECTKLE